MAMIDSFDIAAPLNKNANKYDVIVQNYTTRFFSLHGTVGQTSAEFDT